MNKNQRSLCPDLSKTRGKKEAAILKRKKGGGGLQAAIDGLLERASSAHGSGSPLCGAPIDTNSEQ